MSAAKPPKPVDIGKIGRALTALLEACGLDPASDPDLKDTAERVANFYATELLDGYAMEPKQILADAIVVTPPPSCVMLEAVRFHAMCPHHLLPYRGLAYVGYVPIRNLLGFGRIATLVQALSHRLTLQERITTQVAQALVEHLPATGAGCILVAEHMCLNLPGDRHDQARVVSSAFVGDFSADLQDQLWRRLPAGRT